MGEAVAFDSVMQSLAGSVVSTRMYLERANEAAQSVYAAHPLLRDRTMPVFVIEDVSFDVPYVVDEVRQSSPTLPPLTQRRPVSLTERELASLLRGASDDATAALKEVLDAYAEHRALYDKVADAGDLVAAAAEMQLPRPLEILPDWLGQLRTGASKAAVGKLGRTLDELTAIRADLAAAKQAAVAGPTTQVMVRLDPEALGKSPGQVNRVQFTVRVDETASVEVDGTSVPVGRD